MGRAVEVLEPPALRCSIIDDAQQIMQFYKEQAAAFNSDGAR